MELKMRGTQIENDESWLRARITDGLKADVEYVVEMPILDLDIPPWMQVVPARIRPKAAIDQALELVTKMLEKGDPTS